ncbi:hypothetical protein HMPREF1394_01062 [Helicobacter pylori GAM105Ai]|nr:hypothetical protein HMPREF1394_01062 [Helicobacter pylori GAM105Ai]
MPFIIPFSKISFSYENCTFQTFKATPLNYNTKSQNKILNKINPPLFFKYQFFILLI